MEPMSREVTAAFAGFSPAVRVTLLQVRALVFDTASETPEVGKLSELLRWGEPAYLTEQTRSGSTIRLGVSRQAPQEGAIFFNCRTTLVEEFCGLFGGVFRYEGNRALLFSPSQPVPEDALRMAILMALTYHCRHGGRLHK